MRATGHDRPGFLSGLTASLALRKVNILSVQVHATEEGAVDEFLVDAPDELTAEDLVLAAQRGRGRDPWVSRADARGLADEPTRVLAIAARVSADPDTSYNSFEAGEGDNANIPPARTAEAESTYGTTLDVPILGSYHYVFNFRDPRIGGDENLLFRQAISQAIDREAINEAVYDGSRTTSTGITPEGIPGWAPDVCDYCAYDAEAAQAAFEEWEAAGNSQDGPLPIQFNADAGHEPVVQIIVDNLAAIGIEAEADPRDSETYFTDLANGDCVMCRAGWFADYPTYDNFMFDLFDSSALDGNNFGFTNDAFDALVAEAKETVDADEQAALFQEAEGVLLNDEIGAVPINWYRGDYAYNQDRVANFPQTNFGLILWEQVALAA